MNTWKILTNVTIRINWWWQQNISEWKKFEQICLNIWSTGRLLPIGSHLVWKTKLSYLKSFFSLLQPKHDIQPDQKPSINHTIKYTKFPNILACCCLLLMVRWNLTVCFEREEKKMLHGLYKVILEFYFRFFSFEPLFAVSI